MEQKRKGGLRRRRVSPVLKIVCGALLAAFLGLLVVDHDSEPTPQAPRELITETPATILAPIVPSVREHVADSFNIRGSVLSGDTRRPIGAARIVRRGNDASEPPQQVLSDEWGVFEMQLRDRPLDSVAVSVLRSGYVTTDAQLNTNAPAEANVIELHPGFSGVLRAESGEVTLSLADYGVAVSGSVLDGVSGIQQGSLTTVGHGKLRLSMPFWEKREGAWIFARQRDGYRFGILEEEVVGEVNFRQCTSTATVRVVDTTGMPVPGVLVELLPHPRGREVGVAQVREVVGSQLGCFGIAHRGRSDGSGIVRLRGFVACTNDLLATIRTECDGYVGACVVRPLPKNDRVEEIVIARRVGWRAHGRISDAFGQPIVGASVIERPGALPVATSDKDGRYEVPVATVSDGYWLVTFEAQGYVSRSENVRVAGTEEVIGFDTVLFRRGSVAGEVVGSDGLAVAHAVVSVYGSDGAPYFGQTETDAAGRFTVDNVGEGTVVLFVSPPKSRRKEFDGAWRGTVKTSDSPLSIVLRVVEKNQLRVIGLGADNSVLGLDDSYIEEVREDGGAPRVMVATIVDGVAHFENIPYEAGIVWAMSRSMGVASTDLRGPVRPNSEVNVVFGECGKIAGRVASSSSSAGFRVRVFPVSGVGLPSERGWEHFVTGGSLFEQTTGSDGRFEFAGIPSGPWMVRAERLPLVAQEVVSVRNGTSAAIELFPKETGSLKFNVRGGWVGGKIEFVVRSGDGQELHTRIDLLQTTAAVELSCPVGRSAWQIEYFRIAPNGDWTVCGIQEGVAEVKYGQSETFDLDLGLVGSIK